MEATKWKILVIFSLVCVSHAFLIPKTPTGIFFSPSLQQSCLSRSTPSSAIFLSSETPRRRRRKRIADEISQKEDDDEEEEDEEEEIQASSAAVQAPVQPRQDAPVASAVTDIRNLVGGGGGLTGTTRTSTAQKSSTKIPAGATTTSSTAPVTSTTSSNSMASSTSNNDAFEQMLMDAKAMQGDDEMTSSSSGMDELSIPKLISSVLSTIVTVDFFIVCGFLLWFLAGIFSSYALKNDDIQIAFNNNFETLVQPALGVLMIAAVAGNFFNEEEQEL